MKHCSVDARAQWGLDFNHNGDIHAERPDQDPAPLGWVDGLQTWPVYKGYYVLNGRRAALKMGNRIGNKGDARITGKEHEWVGGQIVMSPEFADQVGYLAHELRHAKRHLVLFATPQSIPSRAERGPLSSLTSLELIIWVHGEA